MRTRLAPCRRECRASELRPFAGQKGRKRLFDKTQGCSRREFLARAQGAFALLAAHELLNTSPAGAALGDQSSPVIIPQPLIQQLRLQTAQSLDVMRRFYVDKLEFTLVDQTQTELTVAVGGSRLTFVHAIAEPPQMDGSHGDTGPFYHFAFNIPQNKLLAARDWQLQRSSLINPRPTLLDPHFPKDVWHFCHWHAHSIFFWDPARNIVEYIARHGLRNDSIPSNRFGPEDLLCASEIGLVFEPGEVAAATAVLRDHFGLTEYPRGADPWAMGDEHGLILCLGRKGELWGEQTPTPVRWGVFPIEAVIRSKSTGELQFEKSPYLVQVAKK